MAADVTSLRQRDMYMQLREATIVTARREDFRIVQLSNLGEFKLEGAAERYT